MPVRGVVIDGETFSAAQRRHELARTAYAIYRYRDGEKLIGYVWSGVGFSYRGTQGMNAGIRIQDFHPIEWRYGSKIDVGGGKICYSLRGGVQQLIGEQQPNKRETPNV